MTRTAGLAYALIHRPCQRGATRGTKLLRENRALLEARKSTESRTRTTTRTRTIPKFRDQVDFRDGTEAVPPICHLRNSKSASKSWPVCVERHGNCKTDRPQYPSKLGIPETCVEKLKISNENCTNCLAHRTTDRSENGRFEKF